MPALIAAAFAATALAQQPGVTGGAVIASEPGRAAVVREAEISAQVVAIDKATRTVTRSDFAGAGVEPINPWDLR